MSDALETGACPKCDNRLFIQITAVELSPTTITIQDASSRHKKYADRIFKIYECFQCGARYIYNTAAGEWRNG